MKEKIDESVHRIVFVKETNFRLPDVFGGWSQSSIAARPSNLEKPPIHEVWNYLVEDEDRLFQIAEDIIGSIKANRNTLVLSERKDHLEKLYNKINSLPDKKIDILVFTGDIGKKKRRKNLEIINL